MFSQEGRSRVFSSIAAIIILLVHEGFVYYQQHFNGVYYAMQVFLLYLAADTCLRNTELPRDAAFHHLVGGFVVSFGLYELAQNHSLAPYITNYLYMEATTPLLHGAWILHNEPKVMNKSFAKLVFILLAVCWIPFRLYNPTKATQELFFSFIPNEPLLEGEKNIGAPFFVTFCILQYYWFFKILERLVNSGSTSNKDKK
jgi:hypothetical protein